MSGETEQGRSGTGSLEDVRDVEIPEQTPLGRLRETLDEHRIVVSLIGVVTPLVLAGYYLGNWPLVPHISILAFVDVVAIGYLLVRIRSVLGTLWVLALTTGALFFMDGGISKDVLVFAALTVLLAGYFLVTLRNDLRMG